MRSKKLALVSFALLGALTLAFAPACGGSDDDGGGTPDANTSGTPDANTGGTPDAPQSTAITDQYIGEPCSAQTDCGGLLASGDYQCLVFAQTDTVGVCASKCVAATDCNDGYTGAGTPQCGLQAGTDTYCAVVCTGDQCPTGSSCQAPGGGSTMICYGTQP